jgi:hypothetical protein
MFLLFHAALDDIIRVLKIEMSVDNFLNSRERAVKKALSENSFTAICIQ